IDDGLRRLRRERRRDGRDGEERGEDGAGEGTVHRDSCEWCTALWCSLPLCERICEPSAGGVESGVAAGGKCTTVERRTGVGFYPSTLDSAPQGVFVVRDRIHQDVARREAEHRGGQGLPRRGLAEDPGSAESLHSGGEELR